MASYHFFMSDNLYDNIENIHRPNKFDFKLSRQINMPFKMKRYCKCNFSFKIQYK